MIKLRIMRGEISMNYKFTIKSIRKGLAVCVLSLTAFGFVTPAIKGAVNYTEVQGSKQANANNTSWRSRTKVSGYEDSGHAFNLRVASWMASSNDYSVARYGYAERESTNGTCTVKSSYVNNKGLHAIHQYYVGNTSIQRWQAD